MATAQGLAAFLERQAGLKEGTITVKGGSLSIPATNAAHLAGVINEQGSGIVTASDDGRGNAVIGASGVSMVTSLVSGDDFSSLPIGGAVFESIQSAVKKDVDPSHFKGASSPPAAERENPRDNAAAPPEELDQSPEALAARWAFMDGESKAASTGPMLPAAVASRIPMGVDAPPVNATEDTPLITALANLEKLMQTGSLSTADRGQSSKYMETIRKILLEKLEGAKDDTTRQTLNDQLDSVDAAQSSIRRAGGDPKGQDAATKAVRKLLKEIPLVELQQMQKLKVALADYNKAVTKARNDGRTDEYPLAPGEITRIIQNVEKDPANMEATLERVKEQIALLQPPPASKDQLDLARPTGQLAQATPPNSIPDEKTASLAAAALAAGKVTKVATLAGSTPEGEAMELVLASTPKVQPGMKKQTGGGQKGGDNKIQIKNTTSSGSFV